LLVHVNITKKSPLGYTRLSARHYGMLNNYLNSVKTSSKIN
jgi:hypothetical protein